MSNEIDIVEVTKVTAKNLYDLLNQLADHIDALQTENKILKTKLENDPQ